MTKSAQHPIDQILNQRKIIITCGTGGVGKTTISAALALRAALLGKKTVVITIDPAKRLATSLGLTQLGDHPTDLTPTLHKTYQAAQLAGMKVPPENQGTLAAIVPDTRQTFEDLVASLAPSKAVIERFLKNPIFQIFTKEFSGTNEYMALERLYTLHQFHQYDCIILDTPPSRNTLAFLDAPKILSQFFEERLIRWLVLPANKIVSAGMRKALGVLEKLTGAGFMTHLFDFASALFEIRLSFSENLQKITQMLESKEVGFLVVTTPAPDAAPEIKHFIQRLKDHRLQFDGIILNRTLSYLESIEKPVPAEWRAAASILEALQNREKHAIQTLLDTIASVRGLGAPSLHAVLPELARDVHSLEDLFYVAMAMDHPYTP